jgi:hypothetical protein
MVRDNEPYPYDSPSIDFAPETSIFHREGRVTTGEGN